jgi:hypothetical protein
MAASRRKVLSLSRPAHNAQPPPTVGCVTGHVVEVLPTGQALVDYPGNTAGPLPARTVLTTLGVPASGAPALLVFENGDATLPIILGLLRDGFRDATPSERSATLRTDQAVTLNPRSLILDAQQEIVLRCGAGSLTIRADGTVVVRGTNLLSRSSGSNRIKGASVRIN